MKLAIITQKRRVFVVVYMSLKIYLFVIIAFSFVLAIHSNETARAENQPSSKNQICPLQVGPAEAETCRAEPSSDQETIPIRGTIISASFVVPVLLVGLASAVLVDDDLKRTLIIKLTVQLFLVLRCPLVTFVTYKAQTKTNTNLSLT